MGSRRGERVKRKTSLNVLLVSPWPFLAFWETSMGSPPAYASRCRERTRRMSCEGREAEERRKGRSLPSSHLAPSVDFLYRNADRKLFFAFDLRFEVYLLSQRS